MNPEKKWWKSIVITLCHLKYSRFPYSQLARADVSRLYIGMDVLFFTSGSFIVYFLILHLPVQKYSIIEILEREENNNISLSLSLFVSLSLSLSLVFAHCHVLCGHWDRATYDRQRHICLSYHCFCFHVWSVYKYGVARWLVDSSYRLRESFLVITFFKNSDRQMQHDSLHQRVCI